MTTHQELQAALTIHGWTPDEITRINRYISTAAWTTTVKITAYRTVVTRIIATQPSPIEAIKIFQTVKHAVDVLGYASNDTIRFTDIICALMDEKVI